ncbi:MAG TPA: threonine/serine exporter family protein [Oceanobacillus sp.]|nr:threonine/serine exporter family protein [Oceanobacillus sp.]
MFADNANLLHSSPDTQNAQIVRRLGKIFHRVLIVDEHDKLLFEGAKPPLDYETLRDVIDLALWAGQLLLQNGAESQQVEETVHRLGTGLGCDWMDILVSPNAIVITAISNGEFRTKVRRVVNIGVDMRILVEVSTLVSRVIDGELDRHQLRAELERVSTLKPCYNRWVVAVMVGIACASFSRLFGGDAVIFAVTFLAATVAMLLRQELHKQRLNPFLTVIITAFVGSCIASIVPLFNLSDQPQLSLISTVLLLIPGVPLINAVQDLLKGSMLTGIARGVTGAAISASIALGLLLAMSLLRVSGL